MRKNEARIRLGAFQTELGWIGVARSPKGLLALELPQADREAVLSRLIERWPGAMVVEEEQLGDLPVRLREYLSRQRRVFEQLVDLSHVSPFQRQVLDVVMSIPYGQTRTYASIATEVGRPRAARAVGQVMARNPVPIIIPCHRVVGSAGDLRGYGGGLEMKERLLAMEDEMVNHTQDVERPRWYITTAIPYVNAKPHIGFALEIVLTDTLARYHRLKGEDVRFLTGTDENSLKNVQAAEEEGIPTQALVDRYAAYFYDLRDSLNLSFDDFIRTSTEPRHLDGVRKLWEACERNGDIYKRPYRGLYCVGCEQFYTEGELADGLCPEHLTPPELVEEENYFFRLTRYADRLYDLIKSDQLHLVPQTRKNEVLSFIRMGLADFSISRTRERAHGWGIPVPGDPCQVVYVWFDALGNYITALGYADGGRLYQHYWLDNPHRVHVIGKGIIRFHAVYWPAMLLSAGVPLPSTIFVHGYVTVDGEKISKSRANVIDPVELAQRYGTDALRYYLLRQIPATEDGDFTQERFIYAHNADLADQLGNLLNRVVSMVSRYYDGVVPTPGALEDVDHRLISTARGLRDRVDDALARFASHEALAAVWDLVSAANKYVVEVEPWVLAKQRGTDPEGAAAEERLATVLYNLVEALRLVAHYCTPFLPTTAEAIANQLGITLDTSGDWTQVTSWGRYPVGTVVQRGSVLFPKLEVSAEIAA